MFTGCREGQAGGVAQGGWVHDGQAHGGCREEEKKGEMPRLRRGGAPAVPGGGGGWSEKLPAKGQKRWATLGVEPPDQDSNTSST